MDEDRPVPRFIVKRDRLLQLAVPAHVQDRREGLAQHHRALRRHLHQRRPHVAGIRPLLGMQPLAAVDGAALGARVGQRPFHRGMAALVDQRADQHALFERVPDTHLAPDLPQPRDQRVDRLSCTNSRRSVVHRCPPCPPLRK
jgi:hypothetical protein